MSNTYKNRSYEVCSGCGCCILSCPVWNRTRDLFLTSCGRNKALQGGAELEELSSAIDSCLLCGACEPVCPEENALVALTLEMRNRLNKIRTGQPTWYPKEYPTLRVSDITIPYYGIAFLAGKFLRAEIEKSEAVLGLLGEGSILALDDGSDIACAIEAGLPVSQARIDKFIYPLRPSKALVVADGGLCRHLREWLPGKKIMGLGEALLSIDSIRRALCAEDLYVIESRGYHSDHNRLVKFYDRIRKETGASFNLDLHRAAIPTGASALQACEDLESAGCLDQVRWILQGRKVKRIVVEDLADGEAFKRVTDIPVVHVALLGLDKDE